MKSKCDSNKTLCPVNIDRIYDFSKAINKLSSNIPIKFDICCDCCLPCDSKIEIIETNFQYNLCKVKKSILLNGYEVTEISKNLQDVIYLEDKYINLADNSCEELILTVAEHIKADFEIKVHIKGFAYIGNCKKICFEAFGEGVDKIDNIIISNARVPNFINSIESFYLKLKNEIIGLASPDYIFFSPIYNYDSNIENLLANIFVNYCINIDLTTLSSCSLNLLCQK